MRRGTVYVPTRSFVRAAALVPHTDPAPRHEHFRAVVFRRPAQRSPSAKRERHAAQPCTSGRDGVHWAREAEDRGTVPVPGL